jgi:TolA-binding protein
MLRSSTVRNRLLGAAVLCFVLSCSAKPAHAVSKEIVELQTQVQQLMDLVQRLQSTMDSRFGVMQHLAEQTADAANQVTATVNAIQQKMNAQNDTVNGKVDTVSGQVQSLNDSVDELKSRIAKLDKSLQDLQTQLQSMQAQAQQSAVAQPGEPPNAGQAPGQNMASNTPGAPAPNAPMTQQAPPLQETLQAAQRDFDAGRYDVATGEFQDVIHYYPLDDAAGTAQFYLGEIAYQKQDYAHAIDAYNAVLEGFSGNAKAPAAQLHKGFALLAEDKKDAGIHELRLLIQRHPQTPEAARARSKLNGMGVRITASK